MPASPTSSSTRRPTRSISRIATSVIATLTAPTPAVARMEAEAEDSPAAWKIVGAK